MHYVLYLFYVLIISLIPLAANAVSVNEPSVPLQFFNQESGEYTDAPGIASDIRTDVHGVLARTHVVQYFYNNTDQWQEGRYTYPLPENAAVDKLVMLIGDRRVLGFVAEKKEAQKIYETAKQQGKGAALVQQHRPSIFNTNVANIPPQSIIAIEIAYQHEVAIEDNQFVLRIPLAITPRFDNLEIKDFMRGVNAIPGHNKAYDIVQRMQLRDFERGKNLSSIEVNLFSIDTDGAPKSATHEITTSKLAKNSYNAVLKQNIIRAESDFILTWPKNKNYDLYDFMSFENIDDSYYTHIVLSGQQSEESDKNVRLLGESNSKKQSRQLILVIDTSGSMSGPSIRQAKAALREGLYDLEPDDRFNVIRFESNTESVFTNPKLATPEHIKTALRWIDGLEADGGTEMIPAVRLAMSQKPAESLLSQIIFITDGAIGFENKIAAELQQSLGNTRFFAVGIGAAPNTHLMDLFARVGRGSFVYIQDVTETQERMTNLLNKMKAPVVSDMALVLPKNIEAEVIPSSLPDLLKGETLSIVIKSDKPIKRAILEGVKEGRPMKVDLKTDAQPLEGVGKLYARKKISDLFALNYGAESAEMKAQIESIGVEHQILTKYTSFVAVDEEIIRPKNATLISKIYNPNQPKGWQLADYSPRDAAKAYKLKLDESADKMLNKNEEITLPQTADGYMMRAIFGALCLLIAWCALRLLNRTHTEEAKENVYA